MENNTGILNPELPYKDPAAPMKKGGFVTTAGWVMFVYGLVVALIAAGMYVVFPDLSHLIDGADPVASAERLAWFLDLFLRGIPTILLYSVVISFLTGLAGGMLLLRRNWGRLLAVALMVWNSLVIIAELVLFAVLFLDVLRLIPAEQIGGVIGGILGAMFGIVPWLGLYVYTAWKLTRADIVAEFVPGNAQ